MGPATVKNHPLSPCYRSVLPCVCHRRMVLFLWLSGRVIVEIDMAEPRCVHSLLGGAVGEGVSLVSLVVVCSLKEPPCQVQVSLITCVLVGVCVNIRRLIHPVVHQGVAILLDTVQSPVVVGAVVAVALSGAVADEPVDVSNKGLSHLQLIFGESKLAQCAGVSTHCVQVHEQRPRLEIRAAARYRAVDPDLLSGIEELHHALGQLLVPGVPCQEEPCREVVQHVGKLPWLGGDRGVAVVHPKGIAVQPVPWGAVLEVEVVGVVCHLLYELPAQRIAGEIVVQQGTRGAKTGVQHRSKVVSLAVHVAQLVVFRVAKYSILPSVRVVFGLNIVKHQLLGVP